MLEHVPVDIRKILQDTEMLVRPTAEEKYVSLFLTVCRDVPTFVKGDAIRIQQVILCCGLDQSVYV